MTGAPRPNPDDGAPVSPSLRGRACRPSSYRASRAVARSLALLLAAAAACAASADEFVVGVAAPLSGPHAATGAAVRTAAEITVRRLNAEAAPSAPSLRIVMADDGCDPTTALAAAASLAQERAALVVGHTCAASAVAAAATYAAAGVLFIAAGPRHPDLTRKRAGPTVLRLAGRDDRQGHAIGTYVAAAYRGRTVAIVHDRTSYARAIAEGARVALAEAGEPPPAEHGIVAGDKDFSTTVAGLLSRRPEVVVFAGFPTEAQALIDQMGARGLKPALVVPDALAVPAWAPRMADAAQPLVAMAPAAPLVQSPAGADLRRALADGGIGEPSAQASAAAAATAAAIEAWMLAVRAAQSPEPSRIVAHLQQAGVVTRFGTIAFDGDGDARMSSYAVTRWSDGAWRPLADVPHVGLETRSAPRERAALPPRTRLAVEPHQPTQRLGVARVAESAAPDDGDASPRATAPVELAPPPVPTRNPRRVPERGSPGKAEPAHRRP